MAQNPDPQLALSNLAGTTRTLDDWATVFNLALVMLPARKEAAAFVPVIDRMYRTLGDSNVRAAVYLPATAAIARRVLGDAADRHLVFCDPDGALAASMGIERLPAFVHLRQDTTLVTATEGWDAREWQRVADEIARAVGWTSPEVAAPGDPAPNAGWPLAS